MKHLDCATLRPTKTRRGLRALFLDRRGVAAVEAAFILPIFLAGGLLVTEFGRVLYSKVEFEYVLYDAARLGMLSNGADEAAIKSALRDRFITLDPGNLREVVLTEVVNADNTRTATLRASYEVPFLVPVTGQKSVTLTRETTFLRGD